MELTAEYLARLKKLAEAATPGPWKAGDPENNSFWITASGTDDYGSSVRRDVALAVKKIDFAYIAAASPDVALALIADYQDKKDALYGVFLLVNKLRDILSLPEDAELREVISAATERIERLEKEADWLADLLVDLKICPTVKMDKCRYLEEKDYPHAECVKCWREAAKKAVEEMKDD